MLKLRRSPTLPRSLSGQRRRSSTRRCCRTLSRGCMPSLEGMTKVIAAVNAGTQIIADGSCGQAEKVHFSINAIVGNATVQGVHFQLVYGVTKGGTPLYTLITELGQQT